MAALVEALSDTHEGVDVAVAADRDQEEVGHGQSFIELAWPGARGFLE
jgi:hypothetical protein